MGDRVRRGSGRTGRAAGYRARVLRRVGLNVLYLMPERVGGTEVYARELVRALGTAHPDVSFTVFCGREAGDALRAAGWPANVSVTELSLPSAAKPVRVAGELALLPRRARRAGVQLVHSLGTTSPAHGPFARVVTVHDLIYARFPDTFPLASRLGLRAVVPAGARRAHRVITGSESARREVVDGLGVPAARVDVVPHGLGRPPAADPTPAEELRARWELAPGPVVLTVSAALAHKNLERLLAAFAKLPGAPVLVVAGHAGRESERLAGVAAGLGVADRIRFTGWIADADLEGAYRLATCFAYPSLHEGFGIPILEAMRRGVPVACSDATSLPEVAGDAAVLFDPEDVDAIVAALRSVLDDPKRRADLAARGPARAAGFTWERSAELTWATYVRALAESTASTRRQ